MAAAWSESRRGRHDIGGRENGRGFCLQNGKKECFLRVLCLEIQPQIWGSNGLQQMIYWLPIFTYLLNIDLSSQNFEVPC